MELLERGCSLGSDDACVDLANRLLARTAATDHARARELFVELCSKGHRGACGVLGRWEVSDAGVGP
jgi:hypothetical protein